MLFTRKKGFIFINKYFLKINNQYCPSRRILKFLMCAYIDYNLLMFELKKLNIYERSMKYLHSVIESVKYMLVIWMIKK